MKNQATIKYVISVSGVGLHNGLPVTITLNPAPINTGIVFRRIDLDPVVEFKVSTDLVKETMLCTSLVKGNVKVTTIEHLMSSLYGLGIDNIFIDINSFEVPILDGSASEFIFVLQSAGLQEQDVPKQFLRILDTIEVHDEKGGWARLEPYEGFKLTFTVDFEHPAFNNESNFSTVDFSNTSFLKEVARARTFGFLKDVEMLQNNNMALGGSVNNAIVLGDNGPINEGGFRIDEEPVKHKVLDAVGDLYVFGYYIIGSYTAHKSGHALNNKLLRALNELSERWTVVEFDNESDVPINFIHSKVA